MTFINNDYDSRLASKVAVLAEGMEETSTVVAICLGSAPDREKRNPEEAAENICRIADQIVEEVGRPKYRKTNISTFAGVTLYSPWPYTGAGRRNQRGSLFFLLEFTGEAIVLLLPKVLGLS